MGINVNIIAGSTAEASSVRASGSIVEIITDTQAQLFGLSDSGLKNAVKAFFGQAPNDAYLHSPTPWGDLYMTYGWPQVQSTLDVISAQVLTLKSNPVALGTRKYTNNGATVATFTADLTDTVNETTETSWSQTQGVEVGQTISYGVEFSGVNIGGETSISYSQEFGVGGSESKEVSISATSGVSFELVPGQSAEVDFNASRGVLEVELVYQLSLSGDVAVNYNPTYKGHHFWGLGVNQVLQGAGLSTTFQYKETIEIGYYSNGEITVNKSPQPNS